MTKKLDKKEIKAHVDKGYIQAIVLFEMVGSPKEHIEQAMKLFMDNIRSDKDIITLKEDFEDTIETEGKMFSTAAEAEYLILGIEKLTWLAFNFMPASIDIKAPKELTFKEKDFTNWLNDLLAKLHEVNTVHTAMKSEHQAMVQNINALLRNNILLALHGEMTANEISKKVGIGSKQLLPFLEAMVKEGKLDHKGKKFKKK